MLRGASRTFRQDNSGAIAPIFALALFTLVALAGIGFDYGRLMAMDTELQNAADQAALAAATQLDGKSDSITRATTAATNAFASATSNFTNETRLANGTRPIINISFKFYANEPAGLPLASQELTTSATDQAKATVVRAYVIGGRTLFYALTPIVAAVSSGSSAPSAMAGVQQSTCDVAPMMICVQGNTGFGTVADRGKGLFLHADTLAAGNWGLLDLPYGASGNPNYALGYNASGSGSANGCFSTSAITTKPGYVTPELTAINTRFDFAGIGCNATTGDFCPATNVRKDYTITESSSIKQTASPTTTPPCGDTNPLYNWNRSNWTAATNNVSHAYPKDNCLISGTCTSIGDGVWDYTTYANFNFTGADLTASTSPATFGRSTMNQVSRYDYYLWELQNASTRLAPKAISSTGWVSDGKSKPTWTNTNVCTYPQPIKETGLTPGPAQKDRRVLTIATVDCSGQSGNFTPTIIRWVDVFLVSPAADDGTVFAEVIGPSAKLDGSSGFQYFGRSKPVLIR
ncbi:MAG: pilus assembly protein TadG-related protein [Novosphingobium sp.]